MLTQAEKGAAFYVLHARDGALSTPALRQAGQRFHRRG